MLLIGDDAIIRPSLIYTLIDDITSAKKIGKALIQARLAACVNIIAVECSMYEWQDEMIEQKEFALIIKTLPSLVNAAIEKISELHSYKTPAILTIPVSGVSVKFMEWIEKQTV